MNAERIARPERRSRRWVRVGSDRLDHAPELDERSMRVLEVLVAGIALVVAALISLGQPFDDRSLRIFELLAGGGVLLVASLVSVIR